MNSTSICILAALATGLSSALPSDDNILLNGNFNEWESRHTVRHEERPPTILNDEIPSGFGVHQEAYEARDDSSFPLSVSFARDDENTRDGNPSVKIENASPTDIGVLAIPAFEALPDQIYRFTGWYKGLDIDPNPKDGVGVCFWYSEGPAETFWTEKTAQIQIPETHRGTFGWQKYEFTFKTESGTRKIMLSAQLRRASGTAWFSGFELVPINSDGFSH